MRFLVPQFIEVEDKIFGPLSFRQFVYLAGAVGFAVITYSFFGIIIAILVGIPFVVLSIMLAFYKVNNQPFITVMQAALYYWFNRKLYLWKQHIKKPKQQQILHSANEIVKPYVPKVSENKLKDLAWSLDIKESMYSNQGQVKEE